MDVCVRWFTHAKKKDKYTKVCTSYIEYRTSYSLSINIAKLAWLHQAHTPAYCIVLYLHIYTFKMY